MKYVSLDVWLQEGPKSKLNHTNLICGRANQITCFGCSADDEFILVTKLSGQHKGGGGHKVCMCVCVCVVMATLRRGLQRNLPVESSAVLSWCGDGFYLQICCR